MMDFGLLALVVGCVVAGVTVGTVLTAYVASRWIIGAIEEMARRR